MHLMPIPSSSLSQTGILWDLPHSFACLSFTMVRDEYQAHVFHLGILGCGIVRHFLIGSPRTGETAVKLQTAVTGYVPLMMNLGHAGQCSS